MFRLMCRDRSCLNGSFKVFVNGNNVLLKCNKCGKEREIVPSISIDFKEKYDENIKDDEDKPWLHSDPLEFYG